MKLHEIQSAMLSDIYDGTDLSAEYLDQSQIDMRQRLNIYRNNTQLTLQQLLAQTYPVIQMLVGEAFFAQLARTYSTHYPMHQGDSNQFGHAFAAYVLNHHDTASLPYLPDVAAIEWAYAQAGIAPDHPHLACENIPGLLERAPKCMVALPPSAHLIRNHYNALEIWQAHQHGAIEEAFTLREEASSILIWRASDDTILMQTLKGAAHIFITALLEPACLAHAMSRACDAATDMAQWQYQLIQMVESGILAHP